MKKFIYLWLDCFNRLDDFDYEKGFLFENVGLNLSSEFIVSHEKKENGEVNVYVKYNDNFQKNFFSSNISDVKVLVGNNGTGKSTIINLLFDVIANGGSTCKYSESLILLYEENHKICYSASSKVKVNIVELPKGYEKKLEKINFKNDLPIYYSSEFDCYTCNNYDYRSEFFTFPFDNFDYRNISTSAYYYRDKNKIFHSSVDQEFYAKIPKISCHRKMEQIRLLDLVLNAGKKFLIQFHFLEKS